ncbi:MAG: RNA pyrophosphohydrolase [Gammaproteobacteria bacterium]|nr:RNA pyrophosphohydrolase [Gammaproteobacteria bacterium]
MIDADGFRLNVGIVVSNSEGKLLWGKRFGRMGGWQFPQGGINENENAEEAMFRELYEEVGLKPTDVKIVAVSKEWYTYYLPKRFRRYHMQPLCIGQKQRWFLLRLISDDSAIQLDATAKPEFVSWQWVDYWYPAKQIILFKRQVYREMLKEFEPQLFKLDIA